MENKADEYQDSQSELQGSAEEQWQQVGANVLPSVGQKCAIANRPQQREERHSFHSNHFQTK